MIQLCSWFVWESTSPHRILGCIASKTWSISCKPFATKIFTIIKSWRWTSSWCDDGNAFVFSLVFLYPFTLCFCVETIFQLFGSQIFFVSSSFISFAFFLQSQIKSMLLCSEVKAFYVVKAFQIMIINNRKKNMNSKYVTFFPLAIACELYGHDAKLAATHLPQNQTLLLTCARWSSDRNLKSIHDWFLLCAHTHTHTQTITPPTLSGRVCVCSIFIGFHIIDIYR